MGHRFAYATVPRFLPDGGTALILGSGPSLTQADVDYARARVDLTIAVNDSYQLAPDADVLYAADDRWWKWHDGAQRAHVYSNRQFPAFTGRVKFAVSRVPYPDVSVLKRGRPTGLSTAPDTLNLGSNGVYQAINFAVHAGATSGILLGVDMQRGRRVSNGVARPSCHFFGRHQDLSEPPYAICLEQFATLVDPLQRMGFALVNCTPGSALQCFPMRPLREQLPMAVAG